MIDSYLRVIAVVQSYSTSTRWSDGPEEYRRPGEYSNNRKIQRNSILTTTTVLIYRALRNDEEYKGTIPCRQFLIGTKGVFYSPSPTSSSRFDLFGVSYTSSSVLIDEPWSPICGLGCCSKTVCTVISIGLSGIGVARIS
jgi:hypothetical protein